MSRVPVQHGGLMNIDPKNQEVDEYADPLADLLHDD